ncbi:hypothetical protein Taro_003076 [Colocasia esculenta]|uniref:Uncharacterized protein n=1 Tax=Colocasia esculenta TaxID=4460 RepID=A0A843TN61_COLES|nr:hypothetical protein [Colocasia esculenta]
MASRGRHGGVSAREGEQRREEQAEQQAPAPQGPVLPPPPPVDYGVFMHGLVQAMQTQVHTQVALQAQLEAQEGEMEKYLEMKKASQKRPTATFQRQDKKKVAYQTPQRPAVTGSSQVPSVRSPGAKKECPHCRKVHGGTEYWMITGKCLKCGSSDHKIMDCLRLQQGVQRGAPAPATVVAAAPATGRPGRPRAPARKLFKQQKKIKSTLSGPEEVDIKGCCRQLLLKNLTATYVAFYLLPAAHTYDFSYNDGSSELGSLPLCIDYPPDVVALRGTPLVDGSGLLKISFSPSRS